MDPYTTFAFDRLNKKFPGYLKKIGFTTKDDILKCKTSWIHTSSATIYTCKFCQSNDVIERSEQLRSMDEGETVIKYCRHCNKTF
jgi:DNA-directed RNA polymerase subunit M/transcription elongation factor TFIIS